ncbi:MAG: hypothetical protein L6R30_11495 [Thermoanaerobaculia bacterium]|nr:hypothetical protein [Thermoanaerobaculia bacterium]
MTSRSIVRTLAPVAALCAVLSPGWVAAQGVQDPGMKDVSQKLAAEYRQKHGEALSQRLELGMAQVQKLWKKEDGGPAEFEAFVREHFAVEKEKQDALFSRLEFALESLEGHSIEITRDLRKQLDLDLGPIYPFDEILGGYAPGAHLTEDLFQNKLAFVVLLNFRLTDLKTRLAEGDKWSRRQWAEARLVDRFSKRIPASVNLEIAKATSEAEQYIASYNIWMHHLVDEKGNRLFPPKKRLLSHWNLRDELKANYGDPKAGLARQRMIQKVMERIVTQTIPASVVDNPHVDWNPFTNTVVPAKVNDSDIPAAQRPVASAAAEPDTRYARLLGMFRAYKLADPYSPAAPSHIARQFDDVRQIPEQRFEEILKQVVSSPLVPRVAALIEKRLGRNLEPFDVWYAGFKPKSSYSEQQLDEIVRKKYPTPQAYEKDIPALLEKLGFSRDRAQFLAARIVVDPARGSGHAWGPGRREDKAHLRTRVGKDGMDYKGFNIAVHEMGHNVEQVFSLMEIDHFLLQGVPNTAFTEALAFVFQAKDLDLLGLSEPDDTKKHLEALNDFWATYEIAGVALVDMAVWKWMYEHPEAKPAELKEATQTIAKDIWNRYYAPVFRSRDVVLLGIYSHMIHSGLYLPDYPLGHLIAFQVKRHIDKSGNLGTEIERMARTGNVAPDLWMKTATGSPVGAEALLAAAEEGLKVMEARKPEKK